MLLHPVSFAQEKNNTAQQLSNTSTHNINTNSFTKPDFFSSGFIDIINNGQVNAAARLIRLYIGEPGKLAVPVSVYSGVSANSFQSPFTQESGREVLNALINPMSGLVNISMEDIILLKKSSLSVTRCGFLYHTGLRVLTGYKKAGQFDPFSTPFHFLNGFAASGLYFQTGAWERNHPKETGLTWLVFRYLLSKTNIAVVNDPGQSGNEVRFYSGLSVGWGISITNLLGIKVVYYRYLKAIVPDALSAIYQFSFNYSLH